MSEIPEDIQRIADDVSRKVGPIWGDEHIAQAILAERERCAKIAEDYGEEDYSYPGLLFAGDSIAAAIRRGTSPS